MHLNLLGNRTDLVLTGYDIAGYFSAATVLARTVAVVGMANLYRP
jgi:hypothetical protein